MLYINILRNVFGDNLLCVKVDKFFLMVHIGKKKYL
jgi:hypothetical protein